MAGGTGSRRGRGTTARLLLASLLAFAALVAGRTSASAHTYFVGSDPADSSALAQSPPTVALDFDTKVAAALTTVSLFDAEGREHPIKSVSVDPGRDTRLVVALPPLARDTYRLSFFTLDPNDLHLTRGSVVFAVASVPSLASQGQSFGEVPLAEVALRWLGILGLSAAVGGMMFLFAILPAVPTVVSTTRLRRRLALLAAGGAAAAVLAQALLLLWQALNVGDLGTGLSTLLTHSDFGVRWIAQTAMLLGLLAALIRSVRRRSPRRLHPVSLPALAIALTIAATGAAAFSGHTGNDSSPTPVGVALRTAHLLSVEVWAGGLVALVLVIVSLRRPVTEVPAGALTSIVAGFARWAAPAFAVVVVTGLLLAGSEVATVTALLSTAYGMILIAKLGLVALVSLLAIQNRRILSRRRTRDDGGAGLSRRLRLSIPAEAGAAVFILVLAAALASSPPARGPQFDPAPDPAPSAMTTNAADLIVRVALRPNLPGRNLLTVDVLNTRMPSPGPVRDVRVELRRPGDATPRLVVAVHSIEQQTWDGGSVDLLSAGELSVAVVVDRVGLPSTRAQLQWTVNPNLPPPPPTVVSTMAIAPVADAAAVVLVLLLASAAIRRRRTGHGRTLGNATAGLAVNVFPGSSAAQRGLRKLRHALGGESAGGA